MLSVTQRSLPSSLRSGSRVVGSPPSAMVMPFDPDDPPDEDDELPQPAAVKAASAATATAATVPRPNPLMLLLSASGRAGTPLARCESVPHDAAFPTAECRFLTSKPSV